MAYDVILIIFWMDDLAIEDNLVSNILFDIT